MKVLHVTREKHAELRYGMGRANASLLRGLNRLGIQADFVCSGDMDQTLREQVAFQMQRLAGVCPAPLHSLLHAIVSAWQTGRMAARQAIAGAYTHLHCHDAVIAAGARSELKDHKIAWGISQHGFNCIAHALHYYIQPLPLWLRGVLWQWERRVMRTADWIICPTQCGRENLARELRLPVDTRWHAIFHALPELHLPDKHTAREMLGWDAHLHYVIGVGQLIPLKRFELLIDAMTALPDNWRVALVGEGDTIPYQTRAARLGVTAPVMTSTDDIGPYLAAADIFVSTSSTESFGMAILEAMTAGLPIVCTDVGGVAEVVGDAAELVAADGHDLAWHLNRVLADSERYTELVKKSKTRADSWPDQIAVAQYYHEIYTATIRKI